MSGQPVSTRQKLGTGCPDRQYRKAVLIKTLLRIAIKIHRERRVSQNRKARSILKNVLPNWKDTDRLEVPAF